MGDFTLPNDAENYIFTIKDRCVDLISHGIWYGIKVVDLNRWFNNFNGPLEQYFAACILDALIYRSVDQVSSLAFELFTRKIPDCLIKAGFNDFDNYGDLIKLLKSPVTNQMRLVSVSLKNERPGKSTYIILREFRRKLHLNDNWFIKPEEVKNETKNGIQAFIFIDDFLGTGTQFDDMYKQNGFELLLKDSSQIYAPLVAHKVGIDYLRKYSELEIVASEFLDENSNIFNLAFNDGVNNSEGAKNFYLELLAKNNFDDIPEPNQFGYGNLGLAYTFFHAAPDNCLHIIWSNKDGWHPLIVK